MAYAVVGRRELPEEWRTEDQFVEIALNALESNAPASLSVPPYSIVGLLTALRRALDSGLQPGSLKLQAAAILGLARSARWVRSFGPEWERLTTLLSRVDVSRDGRARLGEQLDTYLSLLEPRRIVDHVEFVAALGPNEMSLLYTETLDLLADLVSLGHPKSALYKFFEAVFIHRAAGDSAHGRLTRLQALGQRRKFCVGIRVRNSDSRRIRPSDRAKIGEAAQAMLKPESNFVTAAGDALVALPVTGVGAEHALDIALRQLPTALIAGEQRVAGSFEVRRDQYWVRGPDGGRAYRETDIRTDARMRPRYQRNILRRVSKHSPSLEARLSVARDWIIEAQGLAGPSAFVAGWVSLAVLLEEPKERPYADVDTLARYRLLNDVQIKSRWLSAYLTGAGRRSPGIAEVARLTSIDSERFAARAPNSYLFGRRTNELAGLLSENGRELSVSQVTGPLRAQLKAATADRHSIVHLGSASAESVRLATEHLLSHAVAIFDHASAAAANGYFEDIRAVHDLITQEFGRLVEASILERSLSAADVLDPQEPRQVSGQAS